MHARPDLMERISALKARGERFCLATVVRTVSVTAAKAGAKAIVAADGSISEGWIGGGCARAAVLKAAREALADGRPRLVSVMPKDILADLGFRPGEERDGVRFVRNMCPSRGTMDVFVEPVLPKPSLFVLGASPVAVALAELAPTFDYRIVTAGPADDHPLFPDADERIEGYALPETVAGGYVVIATQGRGDEAALKAALAAGPAYIGFVGSRRKVEALRDSLTGDGVPSDWFGPLHGPAGLDLGAISPEEIALSILAEILALRRRDHRSAATTAS